MFLDSPASILFTFSHRTRFNRRRMTARFEAPIRFSNRTGPFGNQPSGHASLPDCFSFHRFAIGERGGFHPPNPWPGDRSQARPVGTAAWRSVGNRKERHLWRDYTSSSVQPPSLPRADRLFGSENSIKCASCPVPSRIMRKFVYKSGRTKPAQGRNLPLITQQQKTEHPSRAAQPLAKPLRDGLYSAINRPCLPAPQDASYSCTSCRPTGFRRHDAVWHRLECVFKRIKSSNH